LTGVTLPAAVQSTLAAGARVVVVVVVVVLLNLRLGVLFFF